MNLSKKPLKIISCVLSIALLGSCAPASEESAKLSTLPMTESLPSDSESTETTAPETSAEAVSSSDEHLPEESTLIPDENSTEETISSAETDDGENANEWIWGEFIIPENWREVLTTEEAFANFDAITAPLPKGASLEDEIVLLMNRNVLCFDTAYATPFESIDPEQEFDYRSDGILHDRVRSEYFSTIQDIKNLYSQTYTEECANRLFYGTEDKPRQIFVKDEDGIIWIDMRCVTYWSTSPFYNRTYVEIVNESELNCEFLWHYPRAVYYDDLPFHQQIKCTAVRENDEWKLTFLIYDNPTYITYIN